jgi:phosphoserine phosphatase RsbU/P
VSDLRRSGTGRRSGAESPATAALTALWQRRRAAVVVAALLWVALLTGGQLLAPGKRLVVVPWLALGPLAASLVVAWPATALVAGAAVLAVALLSRSVNDLTTNLGLVRVAGSAALASFAVFGARVRTQRERRIRAMTQIATVAQTAIQHPVPARVAGLALASRYVSASADALVGGDLFDVVATEHGARIIVGDVRGKGLPAVHTAAAVLSAFRHTAPLASIRLDEVAGRIEEAISPDLEPEDFVTAVLCDVHTDGRLDLLLCGHPAPLKLSVGRDPVPVGCEVSPPFGLGVAGRVATTTLEPGERLLLFTDGLIEARGSDGRFFDLSTEARALEPRGPSSVDTLDSDLERLLVRVRQHVGGVVSDDLAVLLVQPLPRSATAVPEPDRRTHGEASAHGA